MNGVFPEEIWLQIVGHVVAPPEPSYITFENETPNWRNGSIYDPTLLSLCSSCRMLARIVFPLLHRTEDFSRNGLGRLARKIIENPALGMCVKEVDIDIDGTYVLEEGFKACWAEVDGKTTLIELDVGLREAIVGIVNSPTFDLDEALKKELLENLHSGYDTCTLLVLFYLCPNITQLKAIIGYKDLASLLLNRAISANPKLFFPRLEELCAVHYDTEMTSHPCNFLPIMRAPNLTSLKGGGIGDFAGRGIPAPFQTKITKIDLWRTAITTPGLLWLCKACPHVKELTLLWDVETYLEEDGVDYTMSHIMQLFVQHLPELEKLSIDPDEVWPIHDVSRYVGDISGFKNLREIDFAHGAMLYGEDADLMAVRRDYLPRSLQKVRLFYACGPEIDIGKEGWDEAWDTLDRWKNGHVDASEDVNAQN